MAANDIVRGGVSHRNARSCPAADYAPLLDTLHRYGRSMLTGYKKYVKQECMMCWYRGKGIKICMSFRRRGGGIWSACGGRLRILGNMFLRTYESQRT
ncbi:hypothetical protein BDQ17DRAFT_974394 [Cyathus striatus]|nr:hypothetical protein BDQ17DRAFT_974394 [Cyathus striatus]